MARVGRTKSDSGFYHVVLKGDGDMDLFDCDRDRIKFLDILDNEINDFKVSLIAWCLMSNHVHMLLEDASDEISEFIHHIATSYARYFNVSAGRKGSVFQDRFFSAPINSDEQLINCTFYIHDNPLNGMGIHPISYLWCSYREYVHEPIRSKTEMVLDMLGGVSQFKDASEDYRHKTYFMLEGKSIPDDDVANAIRFVLGTIDPASIKGLRKARRAPIIKRLRDIGLSIAQIKRATGIGERTIVRDCSGQRFA